MSSVIRRVLGAGGVGLPLALLLAAGAGAAVPEGPRLAFASLSQGGKPVIRLQTVDESGSAGQVLFSGSLGGRKLVPLPFLGLSWSPDGSRLAFVAGSEKREAVYVVDSDGSDLREVEGTEKGRYPVFSPDGHTLAFSRSRFRLQGRAHKFPPPVLRPYSSETTWTVDLNGGSPRRITPWRNGLEIKPTSFSPDGSTLAVTKRDSRLDGPRTELMSLDGGGTIDLAHLAEEATFSPDGSQLAFVSYVNGDTVRSEEGQQVPVPELYVVGANGRGVRRLTHTPGIAEAAPSWDPSGRRIAYEQARARSGSFPGLESLFPFGNRVMEIGPDGSCRQMLFSFPKVAVYGATWQPGPGREAGPVSC